MANLEDMVSGASGQKRAEVSVFGSVLGELQDLGRLMAGISAPALTYGLTSNPGVFATSASFAAGARGRKNSKTLRDEITSGALFGAFAHYTLRKPLEYITGMWKAAYVPAWAFFQNAFYMIEDHLVKNRSFKGLYAKFKEEYIPMMKKALMLPIPLNILSAMFIPAQYLVFSVAGISYLFRRFVSGAKGEEETDKTPCYVAASNVARKLFRNMFYGIGEAARAIGSSLYRTAT